MNYSWVVYLLVSIGAIPMAYGSDDEMPTASMQNTHRYTQKQCGVCHADLAKNVNRLKPDSNYICLDCHGDMLQYQSHPIDIFAGIPLPADLPLANGKLGCITCHFAHPPSDRSKNFGPHLLRRPGKGAVFCITCHRLNEKEHQFLENVHGNSSGLIAVNGSLDTYSLQCVTCHDGYLDKGFGRAATGKRFRSNRQFNHSIGVSLDRAAGINPRKFKPAGTLSKRVRFFNGKIGCGTCHNTFSKEKRMLVMSNYQSRLCLECHIK
jgi:predicted CXXCH cytochrome family protein